MMLHSSSSSSTTIISTTLLGGLLAISVGILPFVAAAENNVTTNDLLAKISPTAAAPGFNVEGGSVFTNYVDMVNNGQLFILDSGNNFYETPEREPVRYIALYWCSDLTFSEENSSSSLIGCAGRCAAMGLFGYADIAESGGHLTYSEGDFVVTVGMSAVFVEQQNVFEGQFHLNTDNDVTRFWDDGRKTTPWIGWKGHDEGDMSPNAAASSLSGFGQMTWMSVEEVALLFNVSVDEFTPEKFKQVYLDTWIKEHEFEAAEKNPFPEAELEIIEQVKNETNYVDGNGTTPAQPDSSAGGDDGGSDGANPVVKEDDSGSGRQLLSVAARIVSAALMVSSSSASTSTITFLGLLAASADILPFVGAAENNVTVDQLYEKLTSTTAALPGFNVEGGSVFTNYVDMVNNGQLFLVATGTLAYEKPKSETVRGSGLTWCSDLTFSDFNNSSLMGYAGRCVYMVLSGYAELLASGGNFSIDYSEGGFMYTRSISAVFVEQKNVFEGQFHMNTDDNTWRFWDDGRKTVPILGWEGHDEGDISPNAAASSFSAFGDFTWMSVDEVAQLLNTTVDEFTPEKFKQIYLDTWIKDHEEEAAENNPFPEAELAIIEQVKNETNSADETAPTASTTPAAQPDSTAADDGGNSDGTNNPVVEDDSGSGRQLASVAVRFVSAALRAFGI